MTSEQKRELVNQLVVITQEYERGAISRQSANWEIATLRRTSSLNDRAWVAISKRAAKQAREQAY